MNPTIIDLNKTAEGAGRIARKAFDKKGQLKILPASFYQGFPQEEITAFCALHGLYCLPTKELISLLDELIDEVSPERNAIEIGAGNGAIGRALKIKATDSYQQADPAIKAYYEAMNRPTVNYGDDVLQLDANSAVDQLKPDVVVGAWVTHAFNPAAAWRGGNQFGIDEGRILNQVRRYIVVGHETVHENKPILARKHRVLRSEGLFSVSATPGKLAVFVWDRE